MVAMASQLCKYTYCRWIVHLKIVKVANFMLHKFYHTCMCAHLLPSVGEDVNQPNSHTQLGRIWNSTNHLESSLAVSYKVKYRSLHDSAIPHLGSYLRAVIAKKWKHPVVHH